MSHLLEKKLNGKQIVLVRSDGPEPFIVGVAKAERSPMREPRNDLANG